MSEPTFRPIFRDNGRLDPAAFEVMGDHWLEQWLRARLSGSDPHFPIDTRWDEDPEGLVVALLRDAGAVHPASTAIGRAVLRLLDEARRLVRREDIVAGAPAPNGNVPEYFDSLLGLCQQVRMGQTLSWFREELQEIARDPQAAQRRWGDLETVREILFAAVVQAPARTTSEAHESWTTLLRQPEFTSLALVALGKTLEQKLPYLAQWWSACPPDWRSRELKYMIGRAVDRDEPMGFLLAGASLPSDLRQAIEREARSHGDPVVGEPTQHPSEGVLPFMSNAGWRREFLELDEQAAA